jgi:hypothetical protein
LNNRSSIRNYCAIHSQCQRTPWSARRPVGTADRRSSPRASDAFRSLRWMIGPAASTKRCLYRYVLARDRKAANCGIAACREPAVRFSRVASGLEIGSKAERQLIESSIRSTRTARRSSFRGAIRRRKADACRRLW